MDSPLAQLFVHAVRPVLPDADGLARARSATEAFLFRRLESLSETRGRFALNTPLPIAFDGSGVLEVDLLCAEARVAVELDGAQHLSDPVAYRRDRRKDQLLQENGYFVLRFLADRKPSNPIVITGDIHSSWVSDLKVKWKDENAPVVATEFVGTSISSGGDGVDQQVATPDWYRENPHLKMYNGRRGYVLVTVSEQQCRADYRIVEYVSKPHAPVMTHSSWMVENGRRGVVKV